MKTVLTRQISLFVTESFRHLHHQMLSMWYIDELAEITFYINNWIVLPVILTIGSSRNHKWNLILLTEIFDFCKFVCKNPHNFFYHCVELIARVQLIYWLKI